MRTKGHRQRSVMKKDFGKLPSANIQRSVFNRSHSHKTAFEAGYLIPIFVDEYLPGDSAKLSMTSVSRLAPRTLTTPAMDNIWLDYFFFSCPNRLLWNNWQRFMGERDPDPDSSTDYEVPQQTTPAGGYAYESLADYMGIPPEADNIDVNALHFRAYNLIFNSWFRDENLQDSVHLDLDDGPDSASDYVLLKRNKRRDYFTSALPWPQLGEAVDLPLGDVSPVITGVDRTFTSAETPLRVWNNTTGNQPGASHYLGTDTNGDVGYNGSSYSHSSELAPANLWADLNNATSASISSIREAFQLQRLLERDARAGTRYIEIVKAHFLVDSPDLRSVRPEYLGGGTMPLNIQAIADTFTPGKLGGIGYSQGQVGFTKSFTEHCTVIGLVCCRVDLSYQHSLRRMWTRRTKYDYYWPALAGLSEQEILNREIFAVDGTTDTGATGVPDNERVWGYQERYAEYRHMNSLITGLLRSNAPSSLDAWHLAEDFGDPTVDSAPPLNTDFIEENPPLDRILTVATGNQVISDMYFRYHHARPLPTFGIPGMIDHF